MKTYRSVWEIPGIRKTHEELVDILDIAEIFAYCYGMAVPEDLRNRLYRLKKGESAIYRFPGADDQITITALVDIEPLTF